MTDTLASLAADVAAWDAARARSQQTAPGASSTFGCRAETVLRGNGVSHSDSRLPWAAIVGTSIHSTIEQARVAEGRLGEHRLAYRGVPCTIDEIEPPVVRDWKTKADAAAIAAVRRDGPYRGQRAQVMLGAAAAIEAGHDITTVELVYVPRSGDLTDGWVWSAPYDQALADEAADWHAEVNTLIADRAGLEAAVMAEGLRDKPPSWCWEFCSFATACRGERPSEPLLDEDTAAIAAEYAEAAALKAEAEARIAAARSLLLGVSGQAGEFLIRTSGGRETKDEVLDVDALVQEYRFITGQEPPTTTVAKVTPTRLTVKRVTS